MDLLERSADLEVLDTALTNAASGAGSVVLVAGEAGIGKTRLVQSFSEKHRDGSRILWGACDDLSTPRTLGPFHDIALQVDGVLKEVVAAGNRNEVFDAVLAAIAEGPRPTGVIIEDVHWADGATLDVIKFLGRRIDRVRATLILTYRTEEVTADHPLMLTIGDLPSSAVHRLHLAPLSESAVADLAAAYQGSAERLFAETRGNPFLVSEALRSVEGNVPVNVRDAVRARAARLSSDGRAVAEFVSVVPSQTERWLLDSLPEFDAAALDECHERGLIEFDGSAAWYRHELVRGAMEESLNPRRRRALNQIVGESLASRGADIDRIVHHARQAGNGTAIARYAPAAGRRASAAAAHREALAHFRIAVEYAEELAPPDRAQLLTDYAIECYFTNEAVEGLAGAEEALDLWQRLGDTVRQGDMLRWLSRLHWWLGHGDKAVETGQTAIDVLSSSGRSTELAMAYSNLAQVFMLAQQAEAAEAWAVKAIDLARDLGDQATLAHALNNLGSTRLRIGDLEGYDLLQESLEISVREQLDDSGGRAYANLGWTALDYREYDRAERYIEEGLEYAWSRELAGSIYYLTAERARLRFERGEWRQAEQDAAWVLSQREEPGITRLPALATMARLSVRRGDRDVDDLLDQAWQLAQPTGELQRVAPIAIAKAELAWLRGNRAEIESVIGEAYELAVSTQQPWITDECTFWMWRAGRDVAPPAGSDTPYGQHLAGDWRGAADAWERLGCPYERAMALMDGGDPDVLLEALSVLDGLGAVPAATNLRRRLRESGVPSVPRGPRRETRSNPAGLTPRQLEVLELVAEDLTNAEIAERLFLSPKTVDHHVSAILLKLEVSSRAEAAALALDRDLI